MHDQSEERRREDMRGISLPRSEGAYMIDQEDLRPVRVMIFPDRPDCILFYVPEGMKLVVPPLTSPFYKKTAADALTDARINYRLTESVPGRWTESMQIMRKAE